MEKEKKRTIGDIAATFKGEFGKILWPSRTDLIKQTATVITTSLLFGIIIFGMDTLFGSAYQLLLMVLG